MAKQFSQKGFARGTRLTTQHLYDPLTTVQTALQASTVAQITEGRAPFRWTWNIPRIESRAMELQAGPGIPGACIQLPFAMPPYQEDFSYTTHQTPVDSPIITDLSISFDQKAEAYGIADSHDGLTPNGGESSQCDMSRYTIHLKLFERVPIVFQPIGSADTAKYQEIYSVVIPGLEAFGNKFASQNPLQINDLHLVVNPLRTYCWSISVPGLYTLDPAVKDRLAMPNFVLSAKGLYPLHARDQDAAANPALPLVQNIPLKHKGVHQTSTISLPIPAANALITGDTDIQTPFRTFDQILLDKLRSGYGSSAGGNQIRGLESDTYPHEQMAKDAAYSVICVPMWTGFEDVRAVDIGATNLVGFPYLGGGGTPYLLPTEDRRVIRIPAGFVVHHCIAMWNTTSYPSTHTGHAGFGVFPVSTHFVQKIGVAICNGLRGDDYQYQQVAYLEFTGANYTNYRIDEFALNGANANWVMQAMPIVAQNNPATTRSYYDTGAPFYLGGGNSSTQPRQVCGQMPVAFGGGAWHLPSTRGGETFLEVRWSLRDDTDGLDDPAIPNRIVLGSGGNFVYLIGKQVLST